MRRTIRAVAGIGVLIATSFVGASAVSAQECGGYFGPPCEDDVLEFEYPACVVARETMRIEGTVTPPDAASAGDDVAFAIDGEALGSAGIADDGTFSGTFDVPNLALGDYTITGVSGELEASGPIEVCTDGDVGSGGADNGGSTSGGNGSGALARTGFDSTPMITLGAAVLILGAAAVYGSKRRRMA